MPSAQGFEVEIKMARWNRETRGVRRRWMPKLVAATLSVAACEEADAVVPPPPPVVSVSASDGATSSATNTDATATDSDSGVTSGQSDGNVVPQDCADLLCGDHGRCELVAGVPACTCDEGYRVDADEGTCVIDEGCVQVRFLEDGCRQIVNGPSAVALFFGVDYCAGTAITPEERLRLELEFTVTEDGRDQLNSPESKSKIFEKDVENYVFIAIDLSESVTEDADFPLLLAELRNFITSLEREAGENDVYVSLLAFASFLHEVSPFTRDFEALRNIIAGIEADPSVVSALINPGGTALYDATAEGIRSTRRIRELRDAVTDDGILTTGTIVIVTDGIDTVNGDLPTQLLNDTVDQVISIGISDEVDDGDLNTIGQDGSFRAPTPLDWTEAFGEVKERVRQYPERSYLLAYCSSATTGEPRVEVGITGGGVHTVRPAVCEYNAEAFSNNPADTCELELFDTNCLNRECGGLTACGGCPDEQCCSNGACLAPTTAAVSGVDCREQPEVCFQGGGSCEVIDPQPQDYVFQCRPQLELGTGDPCTSQFNSSLCPPFVSYCDVDTCVPTLPEGSPCTSPMECESRNCTFIDPDVMSEGIFCLPQARIGDPCIANRTICEIGAFCGSGCESRLAELQRCQRNSQCRSGSCVDIGSENICSSIGPSGAPACYWSWDEKLAQQR